MVENEFLTGYQNKVKELSVPYYYYYFFLFILFFFKLGKRVDSCLSQEH